MTWWTGCLAYSAGTDRVLALLLLVALAAPFAVLGYLFFGLGDRDPDDTGIPGWAVLLLGIVVVGVTIVGGLYALTRVGYVGQVLGVGERTTGRILDWGDALIEPFARLLTIRVGE